jgi:hypothetical protein
LLQVCLRGHRRRRPRSPFFPGRRSHYEWVSTRCPAVPPWKVAASGFCQQFFRSERLPS